jgi:RimJ/RimL family protein N-acetyltransferase
MLNIRKFAIDDFEAIRLIVENNMGKFLFDPKDMNKDYSFTGIKDGQIVGCAGLAPRWNGVYTAWLMLTENLSLRDWIIVTDRVEDVFQKAFSEGVHRIEATVVSHFDAGHRWANRLNFKPEGVMRSYGPDKSDHVLYARVL